VSRNYPQTGLSCLGNRQHVVAQSPQDFHGWGGEVLISVEAGQWLRFLIFTDLTLDPINVIGDKRPGVDQVGCVERWECVQNLSFGQTEPPVMLQRPDRISSSLDPWIAATDAGCRFDSSAEPCQELFD
jgi:hypothetical protein